MRFGTGARDLVFLMISSKEKALNRDQGGYSQFECLRLGIETDRSVLGLGGDSNSKICLFRNQSAIFGPRVGDLTEPGRFRDFARSVEDLLLQTGKPDLIAHDLHPLFASTRFARSLDLPMVSIQHHHAHLVSAMADHGFTSKAIGISCDGLGHGDDGAAWGCEILSVDAADYERKGHLVEFPLVGGDAAAVENWRPAAALLKQAFGHDWRSLAAGVLRQVPDGALDMFEKLAESRLNTPSTSSLGRLFDGVAFLLGISERNNENAQAPMLLEAAAWHRQVPAYPYEIQKTGDGIKLSPSPLIRAITSEVDAGVPVGLIAAKFHETIARMLATGATIACEEQSIDTVVLSGGCFANRRLEERLRAMLEQNHLRVIRPHRVSCGDEGLALGQAVAGAAKCRRVRSCA